MLGIRRMNYYCFISFIFSTTNIFRFMSSKLTLIIATIEVSGQKYNSRALIPHPENIHVPWQWNILLLPKNPLQCAHRPILVYIIWLQQRKQFYKTISMSKTLMQHTNSSEYSLTCFQSLKFFYKIHSQPRQYLGILHICIIPTALFMSTKIDDFWTLFLLHGNDLKYGKW